MPSHRANVRDASNYRRETTKGRQKDLRPARIEFDDVL